MLALILLALLVPLGIVIGLAASQKIPVYSIALLGVGLVVGVAVLVSSKVTVRLEPDRLRYAFTPLYFGSVRYADIELVEVVTIKPLLEFGGWGPKHRMLGKGMGLIARGGPGLRIDRVKASPLYISIPDPEPIAIALLERITPAADDSEATAG